MQADGAARLASQRDLHLLAWLHRELEPLLLQTCGKVLLGLRATGYGLRLRPVQIGCGHRQAVRELRGISAAVRGSRGDAEGFNGAVELGSIEINRAVVGNGYWERAEEGFTIAEGGRVAGWVGINIDGIGSVRRHQGTHDTG